MLQANEANKQWKEATKQMEGLQDEVAETEAKIKACDEDRIELMAKARAEVDAVRDLRKELSKIQESSQNRFLRDTNIIMTEIER